MTCSNCKWMTPDTDSRCRLRSVSFNGEGYLVIPKTLGRLEWELNFEFSTISSSGVLLYSGETEAKTKGGDYLKVFLIRGIPAAEISLGNGNKIEITLGDWRENRVNDGEWHTITLKFFDMVNF